MDAFTRIPAGRARPRPRRHQVQRAAARRIPGGSAAGAPREPRRRAAVLHRLEGPQHRRCATAPFSAGLKLNEYGLFRVEDDRRIAGETEDGIYEALGLASVRPELRENRGEIDAAEQHALPRLIAAGRPARRPAHAHDRDRRPRRRRDDGARGAGRGSRVHRDHRSQPRRSRWRTASTKPARSSTRARSAPSTRARGHHVLAGIECDIRADGTMDLADDCLAAARHRHRVGPLALSRRAPSEMTDRLLRALACPWVDVLGAPDRPADPQARALPLRCRPGVRRRSGRWRRARNQQPGRSPGPRRGSCAAGARRRGDARHRLGCTLASGAGQPAMGRCGRAARLARARARAEHTADRCSAARCLRRNRR